MALCILIDLYNREIIGYSAGSRKTANLVYEAFMNADIKLGNIRLFHTDRGKEFDNKSLVKCLKHLISNDHYQNQDVHMTMQ